MIQETRVKVLEDKKPARGKFVTYWMQASQREHYNHALEYAVKQANKLDLPLIVFFGLTDQYPEANERHYAFMLKGLKETEISLAKRGIKMIIHHVSPELGALQISRMSSLMVIDRGYTKIQRKWREKLASQIECPLIQVESDAIVPIEEASPKEEFSAATFRPKIDKKLRYYLVPLRREKVRKESLHIRFDSLPLNNPNIVTESLEIVRSVEKLNGKLAGGPRCAKKLLDTFIEQKLDSYPELRNDPTLDSTSNMSPYLHFGQISPLYIALKIIKAGGPGVDVFLEELIVRRELSFNYVYYNNNYDNFSGIPSWCIKTLVDHRKDKRKYLYGLEELENALTHDHYWNAAQKEMLITGKMHGYMRMYWGKKIIEWTRDPEDAFRIAIHMNNKYELDGRDPNGYAGVAWCFGKHDRPWAERPIFGKVRYMNDNGLRRKFNADLYVRRIELM